MIKTSNNTKGILLALSAALVVSNVYIFSKAALNEVHLAQFGFYWFGLGIIWNLIYIASNRKYRLIANIPKRSLQALAVIAVLEMFGTVFFFISIKTISNPAVVSFLANINPLFVTAMGIFILKEKFNYIEFFGMFILLSGTVIISLTGSGKIDKVLIPGVEYVLLSGLIFSFATVIAKKQIVYIDASFLALSRILLLFILSAVSIIAFELPFNISSSAFGYISIGSVLGPFLTAILGYSALKYIEVSKATMVRSVRSLFVLVGAFVYFESLPTFWQIVGGILTISGVIFISLGKLKLRKNSRPEILKAKNKA
ncbi:MAG: DMT family transporter [Bacteroidetes bacterium]|nr:DMT family transporter [Bacteroidota bacterium]